MQKLILVLLIILPSFSVSSIDINNIDCKTERIPTINISFSDIDFNIYNTIEIDVYEKNSSGSTHEHTSIFRPSKGNQTLNLETGKKKFMIYLITNEAHNISHNVRIKVWEGSCK
jgi:hypothetical protein